MEMRFVVLNSGLGLDIYKFPANQTARVEGELSYQGDRFRIFAHLDDAKDAIAGMIDRSRPLPGRATGRFSSAGSDMASLLKAKLLATTEEDLEDL